MTRIYDDGSQGEDDWRYQETESSYAHSAPASVDTPSYDYRSSRPSTTYYSPESSIYTPVGSTISTQRRGETYPGANSHRGIRRLEYPATPQYTPSSSIYTPASSTNPKHKRREEFPRTKKHRRTKRLEYSTIDRRRGPDRSLRRGEEDDGPDDAVSYDSGRTVRGGPCVTPDKFREIMDWTLGLKEHPLYVEEGSQYGQTDGFDRPPENATEKELEDWERRYGVFEDGATFTGHYREHRRRPPNPHGQHHPESRVAAEKRRRLKSHRALNW